MDALLHEANVLIFKNFIISKPLAVREAMAQK